MRKYFLTLVVLLIAVFPAWAGINDRFSPVELRTDGTIYIPNAEREIPLPLSAFIGVVTSPQAAPGHIIEYPRDLTVNNTGNYSRGTIYYDPDTANDNLSPALVWLKGTGVSKAAVTFRVPTNYSSGGHFRLNMVQQSNYSGGWSDVLANSRAQVDFEVFVNRLGFAPDVLSWNQTPVSFTAALGKHDVLTLTPASDFANLAAGDIVTFKFWPTNAGAAANIRFHGGNFYYFPKY